MFDSEFCNVVYLPKDKVVLITWKKFCRGEDYRKPVTHALMLTKEHEVSNLVVDARNGFEDEEEDVEWGFETFIPELSKTKCKNVVFIMEMVNEIEEEMDMWTKEFKKYFEVLHVTSYEEALQEIKEVMEDKEMLLMHVTYTIKEGKREEFYKRLQEEKIAEISRNEYGNIKYTYYYSADNEEELLLVEAWMNRKSQEAHLKESAFKILTKLKSEYVIKTEIENYYIEREG